MPAIPLFGLPHKIDVYKLADADDGAGGVIPGGARTNLYTGLRARISRMVDKDENELFGQATGEHWRVVVAPSSIPKGCFITLNANCIPAPLDQGEVCQVIYAKKEIDHVGNHNHTSVVMHLWTGDK
jgi:hypothetical protein